MVDGEKIFESYVLDEFGIQKPGPEMMSKNDVLNGRNGRKD
jgi:hypothetical protein